jgi:sec-independent protein translocase protein TatC
MSRIEEPAGDGRQLLAKILDQLAKVRNLLVRSAIALAITTGISFAFARQIFYFFTSRAGGISFIYTDLTGMVGTYLKVCFYSGLVVAMPYFIFELLTFVRPLLKPKQRRYLYIVAPAMLALFLTGALYTYYVFLPPAFRILFGTEWIHGVVPRLNISSYMSFVAKSLFWIGLLFETPVVVFFLARIGLVSPQMLLKKWRWGVMGSVIVAAFLTPTGNPFQQNWYDILVMDTGFVVSVPVLTLYFSSVLLAKIARQQRIRSQGATEPAY